MLLRRFGQAETAAPTYNVGAALGPLLAGTIMGFVVWKSARSLHIDSQKARGLAITVGVTTAVGQIATMWIKDLAQKAGVPTNVLS